MIESGSLTFQSLVLLIATANAAGFSVLLWISKGNRAANRALSLLIALLTLRIVPHLLAQLGMINRDGALAFLPLDLALAFGPLLWVYCARLTGIALPRAWPWHFAPAGLQVVYALVCSALPEADRMAWFAGPHTTIVSPVCGILGLGWAGFYLVRSWQLTTEYRRWIDSVAANREEARLTGLRTILLAFAVSLMLAGGLILATLFVPPSDHAPRFPLMLLFAALTYALGLIGWRNTTVAYPRFEPACDEPAFDPMMAAPANGGDAYRAQAEAWREIVVRSGWWQDEALDLATLSSRLGASPRTVSRVLSAGLGENFRSFIGRIRVEAVCAALVDPNESGSVLDIAMASGFNSKASFNRIFQQHVGISPTVYRARELNLGLKFSQF